jgi:CCR4-NOT complex subunit CAF16
MSDLPNGIPLPAAPTVAVKGLSYLFPGGLPGLENVTLDLPAGSRTLLIGGQ